MLFILALCDDNGVTFTYGFVYLCIYCGVLKLVRYELGCKELGSEFGEWIYRTRFTENTVDRENLLNHDALMDLHLDILPCVGRCPMNLMFLCVSCLDYWMEGSETHYLLIM